MIDQIPEADEKPRSPALTKDRELLDQNPEADEKLPEDDLMNENLIMDEVIAKYHKKSKKEEEDE